MGKVMVLASILIFLGSTLAVGISEQTEITGLPPLVYAFSEPEIEQVVLDHEIFDRVSLEDAPSIGNPGEPCLPSKGAFILLPPKTRVAKITATAGEKVELGDGFKLLPAGIPRPLSERGNVPLSIIHEQTKNQETPFPGDLYSEVGTQYFRGYGILVLQLYPVQYVPSTGSLSYYQDITISIKTFDDPELNPLFRGLHQDEVEVMNKVDNPPVALMYRQERETMLVTEHYDLLILTSPQLASGFQLLADHHESNGCRTLIKTFSDMDEMGNPDNVRHFIRDTYNQYGLEYVLIGGDDDIIPGPQLWVSGFDEETTYYDTFMPSDLFYGCLDGPYNSDGDEKWGEPTDGENGSDVDLMAEIYVGRACVNTANEVSNFVNKTIAYLTTGTDEYLKDVLMAAETLDSETSGSDYMDELIGECSHNGYTTMGIPIDRFDVITLYDSDWPDENWPKSEIEAYINNGVHILNHLGHSNYQYALKLFTDDIDVLTNEKYCFIYSQGCNAGGFDTGDCIAEYFTAKTEHGAFAVIMNARYGFYWYNRTDGDNQHYMREFWDAVFQENTPVISRANQDSKEDNLHLIGKSMMRWCYYQLNLFGDPTVALRISAPPDIPMTPQGETKIEAGTAYSYTTRTTDADGDEVCYMWDWDDESPNEWLGPYPTDNEVTINHTWSEKGIYNIRVKAKDADGMESDWSAPLRVDAPKIFPWTFRNIFEKIVEWILSLLGITTPLNIG